MHQKPNSKAEPCLKVKQNLEMFANHTVVDDEKRFEHRKTKMVVTCPAILQLLENNIVKSYQKTTK